MTSRYRSPDIPLEPICEALGTPRRFEPGVWRSIRCINPDHPDRTASATSNGYGYKCYGCGLKGDAVRLVMEVKQLGRPGALRFIESVLGSGYTEVFAGATWKPGRTVFGGSGNRTGNDDQVPARVRGRTDARTSAPAREARNPLPGPRRFGRHHEVPSPRRGPGEEIPRYGR